MSESEKKLDRGEKRRQEEQKDRRAIALYSAVGAVVLLAAVALLVWNSGLIQRSMTALDVNGTKYSAADVQYYYKSIYNTYANSYYFDPNTSVKQQVYDQESGQSWYDFLLDQAVQTMTDNTALAVKASGEGFELSAESQEQLDSFLAQLNASWVSYGYSSRDAFIKGTFGPYMTYDRLAFLARQDYLVADYAAAKIEAIDHPDADYEDYYKEHADELDTFTFSQFTFRASVPTTDADGNTIEMTDEERAAQLEPLKTEQKALADEVKAKLEQGASPEDIAEEYGESVTSSAVSQRSTGASVGSAAYGEWLLDSARRSGDVTVAESDSGISFYYYVVLFEDRGRDEESTNTVRHLLVRAGDDSSDPTQEQYDEAEAKAKELLDQWKAGEATEDSFAELVTANSDDTGSAQNGGLISGITSTSSYVEAFRDWATDHPARAPGDVDLVKTEYGWHIMYYVSADDPVWRNEVAEALSQQDYEQILADASQGWTVSRGAGISLVSA